MKFEYKFFLLDAAMHLAEPLRVQMTEWLNGIGAEGWDVFMVTPQKDNPAGLIAWAKRLVSPEGMGKFHPLGKFMGGPE